MISSPRQDADEGIESATPKTPGRREAGSPNRSAASPAVTELLARRRSVPARPPSGQRRSHIFRRRAPARAPGPGAPSPGPRLGGYCLRAPAVAAHPNSHRSDRLVILIGIPAATRVSEPPECKDPQFVVIDEVAGQLIALIAVPLARGNLSWLGFILFRVFDIVKPPPVRQLEQTP